MKKSAQLQEITDKKFMRRALTLAQRAQGDTAPNPMVGAVLVRGESIIGEGWHHLAGSPHAEIEALLDCDRRGNNPKGSTLHVTLEPCSTQGKTGPCTQAILNAGIKTLVVGTIDPNPNHVGRGLTFLSSAGINIRHSSLEPEARELNAAFNHWIVKGRPLVTIKAAMTLDGKIATATGESQWITGELARREGMKLRRCAQAILVGVNTIVTDDPSLTYRLGRQSNSHPLRRFVLDPSGRTPLDSKVVKDNHRSLTTIVVNQSASRKRIQALMANVNVWICPEEKTLDLDWVLEKMGKESILSLVVEGGGETNATFLLQGHAQRVRFFYAPIILGGRDAKKGVAGVGVNTLNEAVQLEAMQYRWLGNDLMLSAHVIAR